MTVIDVLSRNVEGLFIIICGLGIIFFIGHMFQSASIKGNVVGNGYISFSEFKALNSNEEEIDCMNLSQKCQ